jgi:hypothetical protein
VPLLPPARFRWGAAGKHRLMAADEQQARPQRGGGAKAALVGAALESIGEELARLVRAEGDRLRDEVLAHAGDAGRGVGYLAGAASLGAVSALAVAALPVLALRKVLPGEVIAVGIAAGSAAGAAALARRGIDDLRSAAPGSVERLEEAVTTLVGTGRQRVRSAVPRV